MSGGLGSAFAAYETLKLASILPNAHVYTALVSACHKMGKAEDSLPLLDDMIQSEVMVNPVCFGIFAGASAACDDAIAAKKLLEVWKVQGLGNMQGTAIRGLKLVQAFNSRGDLDSIFEVFTLLDSHASKETGKGRKERLPPQLFTVMLDGCIKWKQYKRGLPLRQKMQEHNISLLDNDILFKCFLRICAATGDQPTTDYLAQALRQRDIKHTRTVINDKDCTQMLLAMMKADRINEGLEMFTWMNVNKLPVLTDQTFVVLLTGCADAVSLEQGQAVHQCLVTWKASEFAGPDKWLTTPDLVSALINMYAKCGQPARAEPIFSEARRMCSGTTGLSVWNSMINGYDINRQVLDLFAELIQEKHTLNDVTMVHTQCLQPLRAA